MSCRCKATNVKKEEASILNDKRGITCVEYQQVGTLMSSYFHRHGSFSYILRIINFMASSISS